MGTRGLTKVIKNDKIVVAQYGQFDHYPSGQGIDALHFLRDPNHVDTLEQGLKNIYHVGDEAIQEAVGRLGEEGFVKTHPSLIRDTGAGILELIADSKDAIPVRLDTEFENDELFCEGVYTVNLDNRTFSTKYNEVETILPLDSLMAMSDEAYLELTKCPVHAYQKAQELV